MTGPTDEWIDTADRMPEDEDQFLKLRCTDGRERYGYGTRWADGSWAGWMIDSTADFGESISADSYRVNGWMPAGIPEPEVGMPE